MVIAAIFAGASAGAAQTLGSVFIVEGHPKAEWDQRIGWFRFAFGLGQVAGLSIGAVFAQGGVSVGWMVAGGVIVLGMFLGRIGLPHLHREPTDAPAEAPAAAAPRPPEEQGHAGRAARPVRGCSWPPGCSP